ncbi:MAG: phosphate acyltransferase PlsX [Candidatus Limivicinus sp.]|jgi:glycerol-3-phosphate acyltransferase PlsX
MRVIIDAMGGDNAPEAIVRGAVMAKRRLGVDVTLVGIEERVRECLRNEDCDDIDVVNASEVITMEDDPSTATRHKKDSSMTVALNMLRDGEGDAVVSAGSTGALLTGATLIVKRIHGIRRAALAPVFPAGEHGVMLIDCGANVECTPEYLLQFAYMGSFYAEKVMGCEKPKVGLLNVGTEDTKGGSLQHEAFALLKKADSEGRISFAGNIEGTDVFTGKVDVVVTDGFTGNVLLKTTEGVIKFMGKAFKGVFFKSFKNKLAALVLKKDIGIMKKSFDVNEVGGTALVGISKPVVKAHGSSGAESLFSAVRQAIAFKNAGIIEDIEKNIDYMKLTED